MPDLTDAQLSELEAHKNSLKCDFSIDELSQKIQSLIAEVRRSRPLIDACIAVDDAYKTWKISKRVEDSVALEKRSDEWQAAVDACRAAKEAEHAR